MQKFKIMYSYIKNILYACDTHCRDRVRNDMFRRTNEAFRTYTTPSSPSKHWASAPFVSTPRSVGWRQRLVHNEHPRDLSYPPQHPSRPGRTLMHCSYTRGTEGWNCNRGKPPCGMTRCRCTSICSLRQGHGTPRWEGVWKIIIIISENK